MFGAPHLYTVLQVGSQKRGCWMQGPQSSWQHLIISTFIWLFTLQYWPRSTNKSTKSHNNCGLWAPCSRLMVSLPAHWVCCACNRNWYVISPSLSQPLRSSASFLARRLSGSQPRVSPAYPQCHSSLNIQIGNNHVMLAPNEVSQHSTVSTFIEVSEVLRSIGHCS